MLNCIVRNRTVSAFIQNNILNKNKKQKNKIKEYMTSYMVSWMACSTWDWKADFLIL